MGWNDPVGSTKGEKLAWIRDLLFRLHRERCALCTECKLREGHNSYIVFIISHGPSYIGVHESTTNVRGLRRCIHASHRCWNNNKSVSHNKCESQLFANFCVSVLWVGALILMGEQVWTMHIFVTASTCLTEMPLIFFFNVTLHMWWEIRETFDK